MNFFAEIDRVTEVYLAGAGIGPLRRDKPQTVYVDPAHDHYEGLRMAEWMRQDAHDRACGKSYRITHKARAFQGVSAAEVREVGGA